MSDEELVVTKGLVERSFITSALMIMMALMMMALIMMILEIMMTKRIIMMMMMLTMMPMMMKKLVSWKDRWSPRQRVRAILARCDYIASWTWQGSTMTSLSSHFLYFLAWSNTSVRRIRTVHGRQNRFFEAARVLPAWNRKMSTWDRLEKCNF